MFSSYNYRAENPKIIPMTFSQQVDLSIDHMIPQLQNDLSKHALKLWKFEKNQIEGRLESLIDVIGLCRLSINQHWINCKIINNYRIYKGQMATLLNYQSILFDQLDIQYEDFMDKMNDYVTHIVARTYVYMIAALDAFDKDRPDITNQLKFIYPQEKNIGTWKANITHADEVFEDWKLRHQNESTLIASIEDVIAFFREAMNDSPLRKVRFKI